MKNGALLWIGVVLCCLCEACRETREGGVYVGREGTIDFYGLIDSVVLTPLEWKEGYTIGVIDKMEVTDSLYYLLDARKTNALYAFDKGGKVIARFGTMGRGPEEYVSIYDYAVDRENGRVLVLCHPTKLVVTDLYFQVKQVVPLPLYASRIVCREGKVYLYAHGKEKRLLALDTVSGNVKTVFVENNVPNNYASSVEPVFYAVEDDLYYCSWGSDTVYRIEPEGLAKLFVMDYDGKERKWRRFASEQPLSFREALECSPPSLHLLFRFEGKLSMIYTYSALVRVGLWEESGRTMQQDGVLANACGDGWFYRGNALTRWAFMPGQKVPLDTSRVKVSLRSPLDDDLEANPVLITYYLKQHKTERR